MDLTIWHNPRCSTSRKTLALLLDRGFAPRIRLYLQDPPDAAELRAALVALGQPAQTLIRWKDAPEGLSRTDPEETLIAALAKTPQLIERPFVQRGPRAALGRPPEAVLALFG